MEVLLIPAVFLGLLGAVSILSIILKLLNPTNEEDYYNDPEKFIRETRGQLILSLGLLGLSGLLYSIT